MPNLISNMSTTAVIHDHPRTPGALPTPGSRQSSTVTASTSFRAQPSATASMATTANMSVHPQLMLTPKKTPQTQSPLQQQRGSIAQSTSRSSTPGSWQHPRLNDVIRRQNASRFDSNNVRIIGLNVLLLAASLYVPSLSVYMYALQTCSHQFISPSADGPYQTTFPTSCQAATILVLHPLPPPRFLPPQSLHRYHSSFSLTGRLRRHPPHTRTETTVRATANVKTRHSAGERAICHSASVFEKRDTPERKQSACRSAWLTAC